MIISIEPSTRPKKRFMAKYQYEHGGIRYYHFGQPNANTYIDGASDQTRINYWRRHLANPLERQKIENLIISPAVLSAYVLWGNSRNMDTNVAMLNKIMK
jgi:hypothetical protein